jgi:hypothetical protein
MQMRHRRRSAAVNGLEMVLSKSGRGQTDPCEENRGGKPWRLIAHNSHLGGASPLLKGQNASGIPFAERCQAYGSARASPSAINASVGRLSSVAALLRMEEGFCRAGRVQKLIINLLTPSSMRFSAAVNIFVKRFCQTQDCHNSRTLWPPEESAPSPPTSISDQNPRQAKC